MSAPYLTPAQVAILKAALQACYDLIAEEVADGKFTEQAEKARAAIDRATGAA
jgi:hypothetical protein